MNGTKVLNLIKFTFGSSLTMTKLCQLQASWPPLEIMKGGWKWQWIGLRGKDRKVFDKDILFWIVNRSFAAGLLLQQYDLQSSSDFSKSQRVCKLSVQPTVKLPQC
jgi:hypothetical protein